MEVKYVVISKCNDKCQCPMGH